MHYSNRVHSLHKKRSFALTHFTPLISFDTPRKNQETRGFLMFRGGIKRDQWHEMCQKNL